MDQFHIVQQVRKLDEMALEYGMYITADYHTMNRELNVAIKLRHHNKELNENPEDAPFPTMSRDFNIFVGSIDECIGFFKGIEFMNRYHKSLGCEKMLNKAEDRMRKTLKHNREIAECHEMNKMLGMDV